MFSNEEIGNWPNEVIYLFSLDDFLPVDDKPY